MKKTRIAVVALLVLALLASLMFVIFSSNDEVDKLAFLDNWTTQSGRYSNDTGRLILNDDNTINDSGFTYQTTADGGIRVEAAAPGEDLGVVATSILTSKAKTGLDGLTVTLTPEDMEFTRDERGRSEQVTVLWTTDELNDMFAVDHFDHTGTNGIRNIAQPTKGLCINLNNSYSVYDGTLSASNVQITLINGDLYDATDYRLGYRWSFTARNTLSQSPNSDGTGISQSFENVDLTNGLRVSVRADDEHGFIVTVNGIDYYSAEDIAYYPNNVKEYMSPSSMTTAKQDIDLSALEGLEGYVTVSVCGTCDSSLGYSYTVDEICGVPASEWGSND